MDIGLILLLVAGAGAVRGVTLVLQLMQRTLSIPVTNDAIVKTIESGNLETTRKLLSIVAAAPYSRMLTKVVDAWTSGAPREALVDAFESERKLQEPWARATLSRSIFAGALGAGPLAYALAQGLPIGTSLWALAAGALTLGAWSARLAIALGSIRVESAAEVFEALSASGRAAHRSGDPAA